MTSSPLVTLDRVSACHFSCICGCGAADFALGVRRGCALRPRIACVRVAPSAFSSTPHPWDTTSVQDAVRRVTTGLRPTRPWSESRHPSHSVGISLSSGSASSDSTRLETCGSKTSEFFSDNSRKAKALEAESAIIASPRPPISRSLNLKNS